MKKLLVLFFVFAFHSVFSQEIKGIVRDHSSLKTIPYASVYYSKAEVCAYSDSTGNFSVPKIPGDTLVISVIGFEKFFVPVDNTINTIYVNLVPLTINLDEVEIKAKKYTDKKKGKILRLGNLSTKYDILISGIKGRTVAYLVKNDAGVIGKIKSIQYGVNQMTKGFNVADAMVRAHLYAVDETTGKPAEDLMLNADVLKVRKEEKNLVVNVDHLDIELPLGGVYIGLEWMGEINERKGGNISPWYAQSKTTKPTRVYVKFMDRGWQLAPTQKEQTTSPPKKGKNATQGAYFEEPNFSVTVVY